MDFDNMTKKELLEVLKRHYLKLTYPIPDQSDFKVGMYYLTEQTGNDEIEVYSENKVIYLTFNEAGRYFKSCEE